MSRAEVPLELRANASANVWIFRPLPDILKLQVYFKKNEPGGRIRPELGEYQTKGDWVKQGYLEFSSPGAPVKFLVRSGAQEVVYEAHPGSSFGREYIGRDLWPYIDDAAPHQFAWPPNLALNVALPQGFSSVDISVLEVGSQLVGEKVTLFVVPPVSFKSAADGYGILWWFVLWHYYAIFLVGYGVVLLLITKAHNKRR
jgi:hypothetical protein